MTAVINSVCDSDSFHSQVVRFVPGLNHFGPIPFNPVPSSPFNCTKLELCLFLMIRDCTFLYMFLYTRGGTQKIECDTLIPALLTFLDTFPVVIFCHHVQSLLRFFVVFFHGGKSSSFQSQFSFTKLEAYIT